MKSCSCKTSTSKAAVNTACRLFVHTNIFVYMASDPEYLNRDIDAIIQEPETLLYISAESVRELIVAYRNKGLCSKRWKSAEAMIVAIEKEFYVKILPLKKEHIAGRTIR